MKFNKNKRIFLAMYTAMMSAVMLTGFASSTEAQEQSVAEAEVSTEAAEQEETLDDTRFAEGTGTDWGVSQEVRLRQLKRRLLMKQSWKKRDVRRKKQSGSPERRQRQKRQQRHRQKQRLHSRQKKNCWHP